MLETNNFAPVFTWPVPGQTNYVTAVQKNKTGTSISVRATDGDWPTQSVTFRLTNAPAPPGFSVTAGGVLNWKNNLTINDTNHLTVIATDNGTPPLSTTNRFTLTYIGANANTAPFFVFPPTNKSFSIRTNEALSTNFLALDLDLPSQALVFTNVGVWPTGAVVQSNGAFFWRPDGSQAGTNTLFVKVSDNQTPSLSATQSFIIKVRTEANLPPFFTLATNVLTFLEHSNNVSVLSASDPDLATGDSISWSLLPPIPDGLGIDPVSGSLSWTPGSDAGPSTNQVSVRITDESGESATTDIFIRVRESNTAPVFSPPVAGVSYSVLTNAPFNASFTSVDLDIPTNNAVNIALVSSPPGAVLVSTPGTNVATATLSWINSGAVSTNTFTIITWDTNTLDAVHPRLTNTATFFVIVREANTFAPVLTVSNLTVTIDELVTNVVVNVSATDADVPANVLKFAVTVTNLADGLPVNGISINPDSGVLTWAPTEEQGPTTNLVTVDVYDDGFPALTNRGTFTIRVREDNQPPDIDPISSPQFSPEGMTTTLSVTAVDFDSPVQTLSYAVRATNVLTSLAVTNMTINGSGILSWTPTEEQGPSTNLVVVIVWDDDLLNPLTNSVVFTNIATELNAAPVFLSPASGTVFCVTTGAVFTVTNVVFDPDLPANALTFATNFPVGAVMMTSSVTGATHVVITWTNSLALGSTQHFVIVARDTNMFDAINPTFSATNDLVVVGLPGNPTAPALTVLSSQLSIDANITSTISNVFVTDPDANSIFHFGLASVVETNTMAGTLNPSINLTNGVITWHPTSGEAPGTYRVNLLVTNLGCPTHLVGTNFLVTVLATNHAPSLTFPTNSQVFSNIVGQPFILTAVASDDTTPATNLLFTLFNPPTNAFTFTNGVFSWTPVLDQIGTNNFSISASDTNSPSRSVTNAFSVIVHPVIAPFSPGGAFVPAGGFLFEVNLKPGLTYNIQASLDCPPGPNWVNVRTVTPTNSSIIFPVDADRLATNGAIFYRALIRP